MSLRENFAPWWINWVNISLVCYTIYRICYSARNIGRETFKQLWTFADLIYVVILMYVSVADLVKIRDASTSVSLGPVDYKVDNSLLFVGSNSTVILYFQAILSITIWVKAMYFLQLIDAVAPLIKIISRIFFEIGYFIIVMLIVIFAFANAIYLIGINQRNNLKAE